MTHSSNIRFVISEEEWLALHPVKRERIKTILLNEYGYDISGIDDAIEQDEED